jgi:hypothetical protein
MSLFECHNLSTILSLLSINGLVCASIGWVGSVFNAHPTPAQDRSASERGGWVLLFFLGCFVQKWELGANRDESILTVRHDIKA